MKIIFRLFFATLGMLLTVVGADAAQFSCSYKVSHVAFSPAGAVYASFVGTSAPDPTTGTLDYIVVPDSKPS
jgi:site-specific recombinase